LRAAGQCSIDLLLQLLLILLLLIRLHTFSSILADSANQDSSCKQIH
jgi:hypothetical protein